MNTHLRTTHLRTRYIPHPLRTQDVRHDVERTNSHTNTHNTARHTNTSTTSSTALRRILSRTSLAMCGIFDARMGCWMRVISRTTYKTHEITHISQKKYPLWQLNFARILRITRFNRKTHEKNTPYAIGFRGKINQFPPKSIRLEQDGCRWVSNGRCAGGVRAD